MAAEPTALGALVDPDWLRSFGRHLWRQFREDRCFEAAGSLSYTSLLALVPLMAVMIGVISAFPVFDRGVAQLQDFIFANFVPTAGDVVQEYIQNFVNRSAGLTGAGTVFLVLTAIILMGTIERSLNRIWRVTTPRRASSRIVVYWAVLTLGPMLMGASLALTSYVAALPLLAPEFVRGWLESAFLALTPFLVALVAFSLIFLVVPNCRVRVRHALAGALVSAVLFEVSKRGFVFYIQNFPTYERLYGALATIPLFLVWIYLSWVVILLGATVAAALTTFRFQRATWRWRERHELGLALRLMGHFWQAQRRGRGLDTAELRAREPAATDAQLQRILTHFVESRLVQRDADGDWLLTADLDELTLGDLYRCGPFVLPVDDPDALPEEHHWDRALKQALQEIHATAGPILQQSVKSCLVFARSTAP